MLGLKILDKVRWHDKWSSSIGSRLKVADSTNDMFVFDHEHTREDILGLLQDVPDDLFQLIELQQAPEENCDFMADSGQCYARKD